MEVPHRKSKHTRAHGGTASSSRKEDDSDEGSLRHGGQASKKGRGGGGALERVPARSRLKGHTGTINCVAFGPQESLVRKP
eukprot:3941335-Rhodomonas_salina.2